jgi:hypothetical protein
MCRHSSNDCSLELIIGEERAHMNRKIKNLMLVLMVALLLAACGRFETTPVPFVESPTSAPEPVVTLDPVEDSPTEAPADEPGPEEFSKYVGLVFPPSPGGLTEVFSLLMQDKDGYSLIMVLEGANKMLWLNKIDHYGEDGSAFWEVKDVLMLSNLEAGLTLLPDGCFMNGTPDSEILVAGRNGVIVLAWRANTTMDKFEPIPVSGIQCNSDKGMPLE